MTKLAFALALINRLRLEKDPPTARYCCLLALAENSRRRMSAQQIFHRLNMKTQLAGTLDCAVRQGLIDELPAKPDGASPKLYVITAKGEALVAEILNCATETKTAKPAQ